MKPLLTKMREHRGIDIGTSSGTHLHAGSTKPSVGDVGVWTGSDWVAISPSSGTAMPTAIDTINSWANKIATDDNDLIYLRKKNGIIYVMKTEVCRTGKWEKLDPKAVPMITDEHGARLEGKVAPSAGLGAFSIEEEIAIQEPEQYENGWYQDAKGNLHQYLDGKWASGAPSIDKLEYLG